MFRVVANIVIVIMDIFLIVNSIHIFFLVNMFDKIYVEDYLGELKILETALVIKFDIVFHAIATVYLSYLTITTD